MKRMHNERRKLTAQAKALSRLASREKRLKEALRETQIAMKKIRALKPGQPLPWYPAEWTGNDDRKGIKNPRYLIGESADCPPPAVNGFLHGLAQKHGIPDSMLTPAVIGLLLAVERLGDALLERERHERPILAPIIIPSFNPNAEPWRPPSTPFTICQSDVA